MNISINPSYYCNFRCDFCYLTKEQLSDRKLLDLKILSNRLSEISQYKKIEQIDFYGGEVGLLSKKYYEEMKLICKSYNPNVKFNLITNLAMLNDITQDPECYTTVSYDFDCRQDYELVMRNMLLIKKPFSILMLAGNCLVTKDVDYLITTLNLIKNLVSVEIKPYSTNRANQHPVTFKDFEEFVKRWIISPVNKNFEFINEFLIQDSLSRNRNSFSDDHVYITPSGKFGVLEFDLNDNEFFLEYDTLDEYLIWCNREKIRVGKNKYCSKCEYFGNCLSEHLREVKNLDNSCNGFKLLLDWYDERMENKTRNIS